MIEIVLSMCLIDEPSHCVENVLNTSFSSVSQCEQMSLSSLAPFIADRPSYRIKSWQCRPTNLEAKA